MNIITAISGVAPQRRRVAPVLTLSSLSTSFGLTSAAASGTRPFLIGQVFRRGQVFEGNLVTSLANYQVTVLRKWKDGSVKHAAIAGRAALTQNVLSTITVSGGTSPSGSALTASSIATAAPSASVALSGFGTVNLSTLLASPVRTFISGPEMVECHYQANLGVLSVWFMVRLWADSTMWVGTVVENGYLDNGSGAVASNATQSYVPTITINGTTVFNNGGSSLSHGANSRWFAEGWIGTDPQITPTFDISYIDSTKLVPHYGSWGAASAGSFTGLTQTYTPLGQANQPTVMSQGGWNPYIGLLPNWQALWLTSGDNRAYKGMLTNSLALNTYAIVWRAKNTNTIPTPASFPTWTITGPASGGMKELTRNSVLWEYHHNPNEGYLPYMLTCDYRHLETLGMQAANKFFWLSSTRGSGVNRVMRADEVRGCAWALRDVGCYAAIAPDGDAVADSYRTWLETSGINYWHGQGPGNGSAKPLGYPVSISTYNETLALTQSPWMMHYWVSVMGFLWDIEPGLSSTAVTKHQELRDWMYQAITGILGPSGASSFHFSQAGRDTINLSTEVVPAFEVRTPDTFHATWGAVWTGTMGSTNAESTNTLQGTSGGDPTLAAQGRWGVVLPAIAYAVDHQASGAAAAYARLTGATNWSAVTGSGFNNSPVLGIVPR